MRPHYKAIHNKLSAPMQQVLANIVSGQAPSAHCKRQCDYGGLESTLRALRKRGLITGDKQLTSYGAQVAMSVREF